MGNRIAGCTDCSRHIRGIHYALLFSVGNGQTQGHRDVQRPAFPLHRHRKSGSGVKAVLVESVRRQFGDIRQGKLNPSQQERDKPIGTER